MEGVLQGSFSQYQQPKGTTQCFAIPVWLPAFCSASQTIPSPQAQHDQEAMAGKRSPLVLQELSRRGLQPLVRLTEVIYGELCVGKERRITLAMHWYCTSRQREDEDEKEVAAAVSIACCGSRRSLQDDIALVALLKACAKQKDLHQGSILHADILNRGLHKMNIFIGNTLVDMYAKCGALAQAQHVFDELPVRDVVSWNALVTGYAQHGHGQKALNCFEKMQQEGLFPDAVTFAGILKACGSIGAAEKGNEIHAEILTKGLLGEDAVLGSALVDMYVKCGALAKAQLVFYDLPNRNVVSWNTLIGGYCQHRHGEKALNCFNEMKHEGISPDGVTFACILKACGSIGELEKGKKIHAEIYKRGLWGTSVVLGNALVDMYAKCGALAKAQQVLYELKTRNVISWNAIIVGYCQYGYGQEALNCFEQMNCDGISPDSVTFASILKACGSIGEAEMGIDIHGEIVRKGLLREDTVLGNALVDMYAKCGAFAKAQEVLDMLSVWDVVSWNALMAGYCEHGHGERALDCFEQMKQQGLSPDEGTFACIVKACGSIGAGEKGIDIHAEIVRTGLLGDGTMFGNALVDMYAKCGVLVKAQQVFDELLVRDVVSWNVLIAGYCEQGYGEEALNCFEQMKFEGFSPDAVTLACILKAYGSIGAVEKGTDLHVEIVRMEFLRNNTMLGNSLVGMYAKCGLLFKARQVFDELSSGDVVSWNEMMAGYVQHGHGEEALNCFEAMKKEGPSPDAVTFACVLKACGSIGAAEKGKEVHAEIVRKGFLGNTSLLGNALVDMYAKCGVLSKAQEVFDELPVWDVISWNVLLAGYCQYGHGEEALTRFEKMEHDGFVPDVVTFACILSACGLIGAIEKGKQIHAKIVRKGLLENNIMLGNTLVDMYAKCGALADGQYLFDKLPVQNVVSWTALIAGFCEHGHGEEALNCFEQMRINDLLPDAVTFVCVLRACSSIGEAEKGQMYFELMSTSYSIIPSLEHYTCMVDLFGRAARFDEAMGVIKKMPSLDHLPVWFALLTACSQWGNVKLGRLAFEHVVRLDENAAVAYVFMRNMYAAAGMEEDADKVEAKRVKMKHGRTQDVGGLVQ